MEIEKYTVSMVSANGCPTANLLECDNFFSVICKMLLMDNPKPRRRSLTVEFLEWLESISTAGRVGVVNMSLQGVTSTEVPPASPYSPFEQEHDLPCVLRDRLPTIANSQPVIRLAIKDLQPFAPPTLRLVILVWPLMGEEVSNKIGFSMILLFPFAGLTLPLHRL